MDSMGKYEILEKIGEGGFGVVYKGRDPFIKRVVAIKTCATADVAVAAGCRVTGLVTEVCTPRVVEPLAPSARQTYGSPERF